MHEDREKLLRELITQLHMGVRPEEVREKFKDLLESVSPVEIATVEEELIKEGVPREEIRKLCDVHLAVFREQLEKQRLNIPQEHPINVLMEEHNIMLKLAEKLNTVSNTILKAEDAEHVRSEGHQLEHLVSDFMDSEKHYLREENALFPFLEKHGVTEPPAIMWMEHNQIREMKKQLKRLAESFDMIEPSEFRKQLSEKSRSLSNILVNHFSKENNILFPMAIQVIDEDEWIEIRRGFDEVGYCCFTPPRLAKPIVEGVEGEVREEKVGEALRFETGTLSKDEAEAILNTIPIDITFVDKDDIVKYFNKGESRIFMRTKAVIGRKVQLCHPQKSIHVVNRIIEAFKTGNRDVADFWIKKDSRLIYIRYFAVRNKGGKYLGILEVTQDITGIKEIEGEKRLLDWKD
ncbi:MAG: DUF438 domain-containing protein [Thermoproteota archaeon]